VGHMLRQLWGLCRAVLLIIRAYIIWINLRNERTCYLIYWTALVYIMKVLAVLFIQFFYFLIHVVYVRMHVW
jgi:hypothetical protein